MERAIRRFPVWILASLLLGGCSISVNNSSPTAEYSETFQYSTTNPPYTGISVNNVNGTIDIVGVDSLNTIQVSGEKKVKDGTMSEAQAHIGDISVVMDSSGSVFSLVTHQPNSVGTRSYEVDYEIRIPSSWSVMISNVNGTATVANIRNDVDVSTVNGTVSATSIVGNLKTNVQNGDINADMVLPAGDVCALNTTNGQITLTVPRSTSATVSASVVNGIVSTSNLSIVETSSSQTHIEGQIGDGKGTISLSAVNGTITLIGK